MDMTHNIVNSVIFSAETSRIMQAVRHDNSV